MVLITLGENDDPPFLALVRRIVARSVQQSHPADVFIVRIDHWFDHKWYAFAGKLLGALASHKQPLTIPPFIPGRVISEDAVARVVGTTAYRKTRAPSLHRHQPSCENLNRFIGRVSSSGVFAWFSGGTAHAEHGSIMVYTIDGELQYGWYASFRRVEDWQLYKVKGLSKTELKSIIETEVGEHVA